MKKLPNNQKHLKLRDSPEYHRFNPGKYRTILSQISNAIEYIFAKNKQVHNISKNNAIKYEIVEEIYNTYLHSYTDQSEDSEITRKRINYATRKTREYINRDRDKSCKYSDLEKIANNNDLNIDQLELAFLKEKIAIQIQDLNGYDMNTNQRITTISANLAHDRLINKIHSEEYIPPKIFKEYKLKNS